MEIERRWLIKKEDIPFDLSKYEKRHLVQSYVEFSPTFRIRNIDHGREYILTRKSKSLDGGLSREEVENKISKEEYLEYLKNMKGFSVEKTRYIVPVNDSDLNYEIDVFEGRLKGLVFLEIEFKTKQQALSFQAPKWVIKEITKVKGTSNADLAKNGKIPEELLL